MPPPRTPPPPHWVPTRSRALVSRRPPPCLLFWHHLRKGLFLSPELSENTKRICCLKKTDCKRERLLESYPCPFSSPHQLQELVLEFSCRESLFFIGFPPPKKTKSRTKLLTLGSFCMGTSEGPAWQYLESALRRIGRLPSAPGHWTRCSQELAPGFHPFPPAPQQSTGCEPCPRHLSDP